MLHNLRMKHLKAELVWFGYHLTRHGWRTAAVLEVQRWGHCAELWIQLDTLWIVQLTSRELWIHPVWCRKWNMSCHFGFAVPSKELSLAQLLYYFDWELPLGTSHENFDMAEAFGTTVRRKSDLFVILICYNLQSSWGRPHGSWLSELSSMLDAGQIVSVILY